jgi:hypothetical protein
MKHTKEYLTGFKDALEKAAKLFEGYNQTFKNHDDSVDFTYRVQQIIADNIRKIKVKK